MSTVHRNGLVVRQSVIRWLHLAAIVAGFVGPVIAYYASTEANKVRQESTDRQQDERLDRAEKAIEKNDGRWERVLDDMKGINEKLNRLLGMTEAERR